MKLIWSWPRGGMSWVLWGWRPDVFADTRFWRLGPLTLMEIVVSDLHFVRLLYRAAAHEWRLAALERGYGWS